MYLETGSSKRNFTFDPSMIGTGMQRIVLASVVLMTLSGCLGAVASIAVQAERERLADLERFKLEAASRDCAGLTALYGDLQAKGDALVDLDQRTDIVRDAMVRDDCALPEGLD